MIQTFSIGETSKKTGVSQKQLRSWEQSAYLTDIARSISGEIAYRRYSEEQVEFIKRIKAYLNDGFTLATASKKAQEEEI